MKKHIKKIVLLLITLIFLYLVFVNLDISELFAVMKQFRVIYLIPLACSVLASLSLRGLVFKFLLHNTVKMPFKEAAHLCLTGAALNIFLPARAGDIFRAFYTGQKYKADKVKIFGTVMFERVFDIIVIFTFLLAGILLYRRNPDAARLCAAAGTCAVIGIAAAIYAYKYNKTDEVCGFITEKTAKFPFSDFIQKAVSFINRSCNSFFNGFEVINSPKYMVLAVCASFGIWFCECLCYFITMQGFSCNIHWSVTLFIMSFIALACMIPSASIFIGPYQMAVITAFGIYGETKETALAVSLVEQAAVVITLSIAAVLFFIKNNISYKELKEDISKNNEKGN